MCVGGLNSVGGHGVQGGAKTNRWLDQKIPAPRFNCCFSNKKMLTQVTVNYSKLNNSVFLCTLFF